ncbi:SagB/ThcOx family dehydrogenase [Nitrospira sp. KM1]|uniref:SagB/ThcOx family dehydrogenase n=1 Tax=Nitrospira sp. KM1 TaxID=1936990 RepID=UPI0015665109|nr:SagB/ThcOx family dehydrogenase [Nitrospira sp. KM1]
MSDDSSSSDGLSETGRAIRYHLQTKHHFHRYAKSLGYLDWTNQPNPFRRYAGAKLCPLPLLRPDDEPPSPRYDELYQWHTVPCRPLTIRSLSRFFELSLGLSAWKRAGESEWALRINPSSGNLHPTEGYLLIPDVPSLQLDPGLYHYAPKEHGLEQRSTIEGAFVAQMLEPFPKESFFIGFTSVQWREAWKYGERAFRYCHHDIGHALGACRIAAASLGWRMLVLDAIDQTALAALLGTDRREDFSDAEPEHPDCLAVVWPQPAQRKSDAIIPCHLDVRQACPPSRWAWHGTANRLSPQEPVRWDIIDDVSQATWKNETRQSAGRTPSADIRSFGEQDSPNYEHLAASIIRQRRSAVAFDGLTSLSAASFFRMLRLTVPGIEYPVSNRRVPWDAWPYDPTMHLLLFVHRIEGLTPGLYCLVRNPRRMDFLQQCMNSELNWVIPPNCPSDLSLYWLLEGDAKRLAKQVSCHQDIAGDGAFSLGMIAEFEGTLQERGAWWYPRMFWESGILGQVLYLEAEAAGVRATGIGCFFDDPVHEIVGIKGISLQSLYHFTVGGPVEDVRLLTLPAYFHMSQ